MRFFLGIARSLGGLRSLSTITVVVIITSTVLSVMVIVSSVTLMSSRMIPDTSASRVVTLHRFASLVRRLLLLLRLLLISRMLPATAVCLSVVILGPSTAFRVIAGVIRRWLRLPTATIGRVLAVATLGTCCSVAVAAAAIVVVAIVSILLLVLLMRVVVGRMRLIVFGLGTASPRVSFTGVTAAGCVRWTSSISSTVVVIVGLLLVAARSVRVLLLLLRILLTVTSVVRSWVGISIGKTARDVVFETLLVVTLIGTVVAGRRVGLVRWIAAARCRIRCPIVGIRT